MTAPSFQIDQPTGAGSGTAGLSRKDLWVGKALNLTCTNPPTGASFTWSILYAPPGSTATITNPDSVEANFTPDVTTRSFRLALQINAGGPGLYFTFIVACTYNNVGVEVNRGWRTPAQNEQNDEANFLGQLYGYAPDYDNIILDIAANANFTSGGSTGYEYITPSESPYTVVAGVLHVDADISGSGGPANILVALPATPSLMQTVLVGDPFGYASSKYYITVEGNGKQIDGASTFIISAPYGRVTFRYNGTSWEAISVYLPKTWSRWTGANTGTVLRNDQQDNMIDTSSAGTCSLTAPPSPVDDQPLTFKDNKGNWGVTPATFQANTGQKIENPFAPGTYTAAAGSVSLNIQGATFTFKYGSNEATWFLA